MALMLIKRLRSIPKECSGTGGLWGGQEIWQNQVGRGGRPGGQTRLGWGASRVNVITELPNSKKMQGQKVLGECFRGPESSGEKNLDELAFGKK